MLVLLGPPAIGQVAGRDHDIRLRAMRRDVGNAALKMRGGVDAAIGELAGLPNMQVADLCNEHGYSLVSPIGVGRLKTTPTGSPAAMLACPRASTVTTWPSSKRTTTRVTLPAKKLPTTSPVASAACALASARSCGRK